MIEIILVGCGGYIAYRLTDFGLRVFALGTESVVFVGAPAREWRVVWRAGPRSSRSRVAAAARAATAP